MKSEIDKEINVLKYADFNYNEDDDDNDLPVMERLQ